MNTQEMISVITSVYGEINVHSTPRYIARCSVRTLKDESPNWGAVMRGTPAYSGYLRNDNFLKAVNTLAENAALDAPRIKHADYAGKRSFNLFLYQGGAASIMPWPLENIGLLLVFGENIWFEINPPVLHIGVAIRNGNTITALMDEAAKPTLEIIMLALKAAHPEENQRAAEMAEIISWLSEE